MCSYTVVCEKLQKNFKKNSKKNGCLENNIFKKCIPLQRFNKANDCITF